MTDRIAIKKRHSYSSVPDAVLENLSLSFTARITLAWLLGRPPGWEVRVGHLRRVLGLSDKTWPRARDELATAGFYRQERTTGRSNKFVWRHWVTDAPLYESNPADPIPPKGGDGATPPRGRDGGGMDAEQGDIPPRVNQDINHHQPGGGVPQGWEEAAALEIELEGKQREIKNLPGLKRAILNRYRAEGGPGAAVLGLLATRREATRQASARQAAREVADKAAVVAAAGPPAGSPLGRALARARRTTQIV